MRDAPPQQQWGISCIHRVPASTNTGQSYYPKIASDILSEASLSSPGRHRVSTELDLLPAAIGAGGVIVGALVTTVISAFNSVLQRRFDTHIATRGDRVRQYFEAVDTLYEARDALLKFKEANSGLGVSEGKRKSVFPWRNREYHASDNQAAESFTRLVKATEQVALQRARIDVVGSLKAADAFEQCYDVIDSYFNAIIEELNTDGWFRADTWTEYWDRYNAQIDSTVKLFRKDLKTKNQ